MFRRWVGPNAAGVALLVALAVALAVATGGLVFEERLGVYPSLVFAITSPKSLLAPAVAWAASMALGRLMTRPRGSSRRPAWVVLSTSVGVAVALAFVAAAGTSRLYWGYWLSPPGIDPRVLGAQSVTSLTYFMKNPDVADEFYDLQGWTDEDVRAASTQPVPRANSDGVSTAAAALELARRGVLRDGPTTLPATRMTQVFQAMRDSGKLEVEGLSGHVLEFAGGGSEPLLFVAAEGDPGLGGSVSNDHFPYYEFIFTRPSVVTPPRLISFTRYYWDSAGMEGFEWPQMFLVYAPLAIGVVTGPAALYLLVRAALDRRVTQRGFPVELVPPQPRD
jgi:hypothetical protein